MLEIFVHMILSQIDISLQFLFSILHYVLTWTQKYPPKIDLDISMVYFRGIISKRGATVCVFLHRLNLLECFRYSLIVPLISSWDLEHRYKHEFLRDIA